MRKRYTSKISFGRRKSKRFVYVSRCGKNCERKTKRDSDRDTERETERERGRERKGFGKLK